MTRGDVGLGEYDHGIFSEPQPQHGHSQAKPAKGMFGVCKKMQKEP